MRVLVDTSVWVDFFNGFASREAEALTQLLHDEVPVATCGVVLAEFLQGVRAGSTLKAIERHFLDLRWLQPRGPETYVAAANLYRGLRREGITIRSTIDCLIACIAGESGCLLLARDRDFGHILASPLSPAQGLVLD